LLRSIADKEGISSNELETIVGTGQEGRVTKKDILSYIETRGSQPAVAVAVAPVAQAPVAKPAAPIASNDGGSSFLSNIKEPVVLPMPGDEIIEMDRMRKLISDHMVMSKHVSPHVTSFVEADVTNIVNWRNKVKKDFEKREGESITFTPIFMEAIAKAIKDFPMINVSVSGTNIIKRKDINIGMATALPSGNLIVPVIKNADRMNLVGLTKSVNELAKNARNNKLKPEDIQGGTFTVTNVGSFGNVMGTPIINQPQVAILALGAIRKVPAVIETADGDFIGIRHKMFLSHSYDHRVVDGSLGGQFVRRVADYLEQFDVNREL
jgi:2-oxoglutarate dehydrogenase E2 component (dihydrolipoamide succinyltransferase)